MFTINDIKFIFEEKYHINTECEFLIINYSAPLTIFLDKIKDSDVFYRINELVKFCAWRGSNRELELLRLKHKIIEVVNFYYALSNVKVSKK